ncbi:MAG: site-specific DNA-methyltransferase [Candidatus Woesearchaeota archaeon]
MAETNKIQCCDALEYLKAIPDESVALTIIDPPYNISKERYKYIRGRKVTSDFGNWDHFSSHQEYKDFMSSIISEISRVSKKDASVVIWCPEQYYGLIRMLVKQAGFSRTWMHYWVKSNSVPVPNRDKWRGAVECCWFGSRGQAPFNFISQRSMVNFTIRRTVDAPERIRVDGRTAHPTQKPLDVTMKFVKIASNKGDVVLDCFIGVGTTAVAAKILGRDFLGCDNNEFFVKLAEQRLKDCDFQNSDEVRA